MSAGDPVEPTADAPPSERLPPELLDRWRAMLGDDGARALVAALDRAPPLVARANPLVAPIDETLERLDRAGLPFERLAWAPEAVRFDLASDDPDARAALEATGLAEAGALHVQGRSSILVGRVLDPRPGERVLDLCAAPGSKTSHLAALMRNEGELVANDLSRARSFRLRDVLRRLGARAHVRVGPGERIGFREPASFDRVLVDAPCGGEGRFHRGGESPEKWSARAVKRLASLQKSLLHSAIDAVRPGGVVVYSTCTFAPEENELVLERALDRYGDAIELEPIALDHFPSIDPCTEWRRPLRHDLAAARRLVPPDMDGFFVARIRRLR